MGRDLRPSPLGVAGELLLGGVGTARGYLGRPGRTAGSFVPDPFGGVVGGRLYRTGDLVRWRPDGELDYLGRLDHQVKLRGFRIELGEIEAELARHPGVRQAAVTVRSGEGGGPRLVAYVVAREPGSASPDSLRAALGERLPEYMVPSAWVELSQLPLTVTGKVDRRALPAPEREVGRGVPLTPAESTLAMVWSRVLGVEGVGAEDDFFSLGGDSILSLQVAAEARRSGLELTPRQVFEHPTVRSLAQVAGQRSAVAAEQGPVVGEVPLTPIQRWFFAQDLAAPQHWNQAVVLELREALAATVVARALGALLVHHDALRARYRRSDSGWVQELGPPAGAVPLTVLDLSALPAARRPSAFAVAAEGAQASLDLQRGPLLRTVLAHGSGSAANRLLLVIHHLVVDGVSWRVLVADLETACRQLLRGAPLQLPPKTTSYRRWAEALAAAAGEGRWRGELEHWRRASRAAALPPPADRPEGANPEGAAANLRFTLDPEATRAFLREKDRSGGPLMEAALMAALGRAWELWNGERRLGLLLEGHGREDVLPGIDLSRTVGWFTSLYPLVFEVPAVAECGERLVAARQALAAVPGRGFGHGVLRHLDSEAAPELAGMADPPLTLNYLGQLDTPLEAEGLFALGQTDPGPMRHRRDPRPAELEVGAQVVGGHLVVDLVYGAERYGADRVAAFADALAAELCALSAHLRRPAAGVLAAAPSVTNLTESDLQDAIEEIELS